MKTLQRYLNSIAKVNWIFSNLKDISYSLIQGVTFIVALGIFQVHAQDCGSETKPGTCPAGTITSTSQSQVCPDARDCARTNSGLTCPDGCQVRCSYSDCQPVQNGSQYTNPTVTADCHCEPIPHQCRMEINIKNPVVSSGQDLEFSIYIQHVLKNTVTTPLMFSIQDLSGNIVFTAKTEDYTFQQNDELTLTRSIHIPSNLVPGLYFLYFKIQGMSRLMGPSKAFQIKN